MAEEILGIIGGTGLYNIEGLSDLEEVEVETPFGKPSGKYLRGQLGGRTCIFLSRHNSKHNILPHEINYRANIFGMKKLGAQMILSVSAVGSMKEELQPGDLVFPHQFFDRTRMRPSTFFGEGIAAHIPFGDPLCIELSDILYTLALELDCKAHRGGTYLCMEGPQFSTRGESKIYRSWGIDIIGMTALQEAKLAREAEMCFATIALVTDYDCWHDTHENVSVESVLEVLKNNVVKARKLLEKALPRIVPSKRSCSCESALKGTLITKLEDIPLEIKEKLNPIIGKYFKED